ncbi:MAG: hypothetical protein H7250_02280 [Flavobacterium sp.]|nr:hypothetical protein [Flavobacterium sp.]
MKNYISISLILLIIFACSATKTNIAGLKESEKLKSDTIKIANAALEYEIIIIDAGFSNWFNFNAKPRNFYSQDYFETRNKIWVNEWNVRAMQPSVYNSNLYEMRIDYEPNINYGYEVNYMLFNYLNYFQIVNNTKLGVFSPRI